MQVAMIMVGDGEVAYTRFKSGRARCVSLSSSGEFVIHSFMLGDGSLWSISWRVGGSVILSKGLVGVDG